MAGLSTPLGLLALGSLVPLILLYILQPDPRRLSVPTLEFLPNIDDEGGSDPVLEKLRRNLLLLIQIAVLILAALALASPYIDVTRSAAADETVIVLDGTASMATEDGGATRFDRAASYAVDEVTGTTSVVVVGSSANVVLEDGSASEARSAVETATVTDATGSISDGISRGAAVAGDEARLVVASDFAGGSDWEGAVEEARASGVAVGLRQFGGGGEDNAGIVDMSFGGGSVTVQVANFGDEQKNVDLSFAGQSESLSLEAGDFGSTSFGVPTGRGTIELSPGDSFPTDNTARVVGQPGSLDVLLVTNDRNRFLTAAFDSMNEVNHEVVGTPVPGFDGAEYDVVVFEAVNTDRLLDRTVRSARDTVSAGGGVVFVAQEGLSGIQETYGDLLNVEAGNVVAGDGIDVVSDDELVRNVEFPVPQEYVEAELTEGRALVESGSGDPLIATTDTGNGRVLYYGFMRDASEFHNSYQYPVFWRDALYHVSSRERLSSMNRETGDTLSFAEERTVGTPDGEATATTIVMDDAGLYNAGTVYSANLLDATESDVSATSINETEAAEAAEQSREETVPFDLTPYTALAALVFVVAEIGVMRYRGEI
ncbi:BatA domain-containing protein [Haladaptatus sp. F3-133]|uniref:BatA domain-containing protein n=1 Tax=Halorutilus salinus TaxID=2487751 RepID=A0A9Q4GG89_9EURY|nr:BatA domain-containing protein [Halorutilus salinus]MCX2818899.1 BatA domain-containing protein [Halorutilus salinus]